MTMPSAKEQAATKPANIMDATAAFENWLARHVSIVPRDLTLKHQHMAEAAFPFFRATFYRWTQWWPIVCEELSRAPQLLAVGDLHVENFGTWRDIEGRLIWGVNDFDEAWPAAYTVDLVRLLASCHLAIAEEHLSVTRREACEAIEQGYRDSIAKGGSPYVLAERHRWLRLLASHELRDPVHFWKKIEGCPPYKGKLPEDVEHLLHASVPLRKPVYEMNPRIAGLGSLGHPRVLALAEWHGAHIVREAKELRPSAWTWGTTAGTGEILSKKIGQDAVRVCDPHVHFTKNWLVRRLGPDCSHIEMAMLPIVRDEEKLLYAMGWETANIHFGSEQAIPAVKRDLTARRGRWLHKAAKSMAKVMLKDWKEWRSAWKDPRHRPQ
jgi:Uncharacterized protein conserved in bacteria (DUF2252)